MRKSRFTKTQIIAVLHKWEAGAKALEEEDRELKRGVEQRLLFLSVVKGLLERSGDDRAAADGLRVRDGVRGSLAVPSVPRHGLPARVSAVSVD
jgi:hypothetical protein